MRFIGTSIVAIGAIAAVLAAAGAASADHRCRVLRGWGGGNDIGTAKYQASQALERRAEVWSDRHNHHTYRVASAKEFSCKRGAGGVDCWATANVCRKAW